MILSDVYLILRFGEVVHVWLIEWVIVLGVGVDIREIVVVWVALLQLVRLLLTGLDVGLDALLLHYHIWSISSLNYVQLIFLFGETQIALGILRGWFIFTLAGDVHVRYIVKGFVNDVLFITWRLVPLIQGKLWHLSKLSEYVENLPLDSEIVKLTSLLELLIHLDQCVQRLL